MDTISEVSDKKVKRWEKKKKKLQAFLSLVQTDEESTKNNNKEDLQEGKSKTTISDETAKIRAAIRARQKEALAKPKLFLQPDPSAPLVDGDVVHRSLSAAGSLFMQDLQQLLLYSFQGVLVSYIPRWCKLLRWTKISHVVVIEVPGIGSQTYHQYKNCFPNTQQQCPLSVELVNPLQYESCPLNDILYVPLSMTQVQKMNERNSEMKVVPVVKQPCVEVMVKRPFDRTSIILSLQQMVSEHYPLPIGRYLRQGFKFSQPKYDPITASSPMYAVDCEMCFTAIKQLEVTHIAVIDEKGKCVYETYVKPFNPILDYLTQYSGITEEKLKNVKTRLSEVQTQLAALLPKDAIWCGQSLSNDLCALKLFHPYVIDTSVIYNLKGERRQKSSLQALSATFLGRSIQCLGPEGHNPVEDALATMDLVLLKLQNGLLFGDVAMGGPMAFKTADGKTFAPPKKAGKEVEASDAEGSDGSAPEASSDSSAEKVNSRKRKNKDEKQDAKKRKHCVEEESSMECKNEEVDKVDPTDQRIKVFFKAKGTDMKRPFLDILKEHKKTACMIAPAESLKTHNPGDHDAETVEIVKRKSAVKACCEKITSHFFVWTQLPSVDVCKDDGSEEEQEDNPEKKLEKIDKAVKKITSSCSAGTLVTVLLPGQHSNEESLCLLGIT